MKNRANKLAQDKRRKQIKKMMEDPDVFMKNLGTEITEDDVIFVHEIARESRIERLIQDLDIDPDKYDKTKKKVIKLNPKSSEFKLISTLFKNHRGKYKVEDLINEYHDSILRDSIPIGMDYGKKLIFEDIQNKRFTKEDILNMSDVEIKEYCHEEVEKI